MRGSMGGVVEEVEGAYGGLGAGGVEARWRRSIFIPMSGESLKLIKRPPLAILTTLVGSYSASDERLPTTSSKTCCVLPQRNLHLPTLCQEGVGGVIHRESIIINVRHFMFEKIYQFTFCLKKKDVDGRVGEGSNFSFVA